MEYQNKTDSSKASGAVEEPRVQEQTKAVGIPLIVFVLLCIIALLLRLRYSKRRIGTLALEQDREKLEPNETPLNIRFKSLIGRGSFGVVWKATLNDVIVAVKMCSVQQRDRWEKEKEVLLSIDHHPNIIKMIDSEVRQLKDEIALAIVLEFIDNGNLRTHLMEHHLNIDKALFLLKSLFDGLAFLHSRKGKAKNKKCIVHRDIKSSNILVSSFKGSVIADFGLALILDEELAPEYVEAKAGTSRYMAPEKLAGAIDFGNIYHALCLIDIYAASIVTYEIMARCNFEFDYPPGYYEALAYKLPFSDQVGLQPSYDEMKRLVVQDNFRPAIPTEWDRNTVVRQVKDIIRACWDKDPKQRKSAEQIVQEITMIFVKHESSCSCFEDVIQCTKSETSSHESKARIEINENYAKINESFTDSFRSTYL